MQFYLKIGTFEPIFSNMLQRQLRKIQNDLFIMALLLLLFIAQGWKEPTNPWIRDSTQWLIK